MTKISIYPANTEELCRSLNIERSITQKERDSIADEDFAGPHHSFPIDSQEHLDAAAKLIGHADDPAAVKKKAISIAKRKGFKLPESWQEDEGKDDDKKEDRSVAADTTTEHEEAVIQRVQHEPTYACLYAPITRIDDKKWEVEGVATSEAVDSYGTIFSYEASKKAFQRWIERTANVREMHDRKAVGKGIGVYFDDENKQVIVRSRVSRGARDTWEKILDGTLSGYSVGATQPTWDKIERNGKTYPYLVDYELAELSYVDNASNPDGQGLSLCRADGLTEVVDVSEPEPEQSVTSIVTEQQAHTPSVTALASSPSPSLERAGARLSAETQSGMHAARDGALMNAMALMNLCTCDECKSMMCAIDPDEDGDIDLPGAGPMLDPDQDAEALAERIAERVLAKVITRFDAPVTRMHAIAGQFARIQTPEIDLKPLQASLETIIGQLVDVPTKASFDEVRSALAEVKGQVDVIAAQPMPGGPVLNGGGHPVDKRLANQPSHDGPQQHDTAAVRAVLDRLQATGALNSIEAQTAAASLLIQPMPGRRG